MAERRRKKPQKKPFNVDIAEQRIVRLFEMAERAFPERPELADRYVEMARRISMRHRTGIPGHMKRRMCRECGAFLVPGNNSRVRLDGERVLITCLRCGAIRRYPYR